MEKIKNLVNEFVEKYEFNNDNKCILEHYWKKYDLENPKKELIKTFLFENVLFEIEEIDKEIIKKINNFDDYISFYDWVIDIKNYDLIRNIELFWNFIDAFWNKDDFYKNLMKWQEKAYREWLEDIKNKFVEFLEEKYSNLK